MTRTFGAPAGACGRTGQSSFESSYFLAILPLKPAMRGSSAAGFCGWVQPVTSRQPARVPSAKQRVLLKGGCFHSKPTSSAAESTGSYTACEGTKDKG